MPHQTLDARIARFVRKHHLLSVCTAKENKPYCASCFYAFIESSVVFVVATDATTTHGTQALENRYVAGTIATHTMIVGKIQGVQFSGEWREANTLEREAYFKRFPYALAMTPRLWAIEITALKFTDNTLGFGKKLEFRRIEL